MVGNTIDGLDGVTDRHKNGIEITAGATDTILDNNQILNSGTADIVDGGTRTRINGLGREASGGGAPTAADWNFGDMVQDTDNPANHWVLDYDGTFRQVA